MRIVTTLLAYLVFFGHAAHLQSAIPTGISTNAQTADAYACLKTIAGLLLSANPELSFRSSHSSLANMRRLDLSMASEGIASPSAGRRAVLSAVPLILAPSVAAARGGTIRYVGTYDDPQHPDCRRAIKVEGSGIVITGTDELGGPEWKVFGKVTGDEVVIDFSPKGGPSGVVAKFEGDIESVTKPTPASLTFPDGNVWSRLNRVDLVKAVSFAGGYAQVIKNGKESLKRKVKMTGYRATITGVDEMGGPEWEVKGRFEDNKLTMDFSSRGGPSAVVAEMTGEGLKLDDGTLWRAVSGSR